MVILTSVPSDLVPTKEAARILRRSVSTVSRWVEIGKLTPALKIDGQRGPMWFDRATVEAIRAEEDAKYEPSGAAS